MSLKDTQAFLDEVAAYSNHMCLAWLFSHPYLVDHLTPSTAIREALAKAQVYQARIKKNPHNVDRPQNSTFFGN